MQQQASKKLSETNETKQNADSSQGSRAASIVSKNLESVLSDKALNKEVRRRARNSDLSEVIDFKETIARTQTQQSPRPRKQPFLH